MRTSICGIVLFAFSTAVGCQDPGPGQGMIGDPDLGGIPIDNTPHFAPTAGSVTAVEVRAPSATFNELSASFYAEEQPGFHREVQRIGSCRLLSFQSAQCDSFCVGVCVEKNVCKPFPARLSAGALGFSGMKVPVTLKPQMQNFYYADPAVTGDLFGAGDTIGVEAAGADFAGFRLTTAGVATLETSSVVNDEIRLEDGADYTFSWTPSGDPRARVRLTLNSANRSHGQPYEGIIECDGPDTGRLTLPKELITPFPDTYRWEICVGRDCPLSSALRYTRTEGTAGGRKVSLTVGNQQSFWVLHRPPR